MKWSDANQLRGQRLLLRSLPTSEARYGMIVLPPSRDFTDLRAEVVAVGDAVNNKALQPGLTVIVRRTSRYYLSDDLWICTEREVLAVVSDD